MATYKDSGRSRNINAAYVLYFTPYDAHDYRNRVHVAAVPAVSASFFSS